MLDTQYRMHPEIGDLVGGIFYDGRLRHATGSGVQQSIAAREPFAGAPVVMVDTDGRGACATPEGSYSRFNETTAAACVELAQRAVDDGIESVAIITPYVEQSKQIRRRLSDHPELRDRVECRTVHRFQGGERDMVIFDTVDAEPFKPGMLLSSTGPGSAARNLINVSISRARGKLIIMADAAYFSRHEPTGVISDLVRRVGDQGLSVSLT